MFFFCVSYLGRGRFAPGLFRLLLCHGRAQVQGRRGSRGRRVVMVRLVLMMVMMLSVHMVLTGAGHDAVAGTGTGVHSRAATTRAGRVTVVQELEPVRHVKVFH